MMSKLKDMHQLIFPSLQQQNKMNQNTLPHSPSYQSSGYNSKNTRLYHQLLQSNYLSDHIYNPSANSCPPAAIRFVPPPLLPKYEAAVVKTSQKEDLAMRSPRYMSPYKTADGTKHSLQITQSLTSNYSIIEIQNESHSTINLYNLSKNNIEPDLSISSSNITAKLHHESSHLYIPEGSKQSEMLLQGSANREQPTLQQISCLESQEKMRKYRSEEYSGQVSKDPINQEQNQEIESPLPRLLANKYIKNDISRKFSSSNNGEAETANFKTVLNEIHVVPYIINKEVQPYAFSVPADKSKGNAVEKRVKASSLNLQNSRHSYQRQEERPKKTLYFSNHPHHANHEAVRPQLHISTNNTPAASQSDKPLRQVPKSEPKPHHAYNEKTPRSNSISCKLKPIVGPAKSENQGQNQPNERLEQSKVERVFRNEAEKEGGLKDMKSFSQSVIYDESQINLCCGLSRNQTQPNANRIIFKQKDQPKCINFCENAQSIEVNNLGKPKRGSTYKINPVQVIKSFNENRESESQKKGIKLVGFNASFPKKNEG